MGPSDTIAAISTPLGRAGIGVIRISGPDSLHVSKKVFAPSTGKAGFRPRQVYSGAIVDSKGAKIDSCLFVWMKGPHSYTGEDVCEISCHGSPVALKRVLDEVFAEGRARPAGPGEFTKRAYLNGKIDLIQAEAVMDIINAETDLALRSAEAQLSGKLSLRINGIKDALSGLMASIEAGLDFPDDGIEGIGKQDILEEAGSILAKTKALLETFRQGMAIRHGLKALMLGRPNVGKSSLLNCILREDRAIVTEEPGTTRDVLEETISIRGMPFRIMDTAGLRKKAESKAEAIGAGLAIERITRADIVLFVIDASSGSFEEDILLLKHAEAKKTIVVANKSDLIKDSEKRGFISGHFKGHEVVFVSALKEEGIEGLKDAMFKEASGHSLVPEDDVIITSLRHEGLLRASCLSLKKAIDATDKGLHLEFVAEDLRSSLKSLGEITGAVTTEDILDRVFSGFCIGK
jgi:tRNA modification GTPase